MMPKSNPFLFRYFDKNKRSLFPEIKDWSDPQNELRNVKNIKKMKQGEWMFFHPSAYKFYYFAVIVVPLFMFISVATWMIWKEVYIVAAILGIFSAFMVKELYKKVKNRKFIHNFTFYDLYMREYPENEE